MTTKNERRSRDLHMAKMTDLGQHVFCSEATGATNLKSRQSQTAYRFMREGTGSHGKWRLRQDQTDPRDNMLIVFCIFLVLSVYITLEG